MVRRAWWLIARDAVWRCIRIHAFLLAANEGHSLDGTNILFNLTVSLSFASFAVGSPTDSSRSTGYARPMAFHIHNRDGKPLTRMADDAAEGFLNEFTSD